MFHLMELKLIVCLEVNPGLRVRSLLGIGMRFMNNSSKQVSMDQLINRAAVMTGVRRYIAVQRHLCRYFNI